MARPDDIADGTPRSSGSGAFARADAALGALAGPRARSLSPVMVGRESELARLRVLHPTTGPEVVFVGGEAGVGKSRLVTELAATPPASSVLLVGQANPVELGRPYQVMLDAVAPHVATWESVPDALAARATALATLLSPVAPLLTGGTDRPLPAGEVEAAAVELVRHLVGSGPGLVVLDDLHWADPESVAWFDHLATAPGLSIVLVGTYRPEDLDRQHPASSIVLGLERRASVTRVELGRLDLRGVRALLGAVFERPVPMEVAEALLVRTGGNPFFLEELVAAAEGLEPEQLPAAQLPWSVHEAVLRRLDRLGDAPRRLAEVAALLGPRIEFDVLAAVADRGEDDLIDELRQLVGEGVLTETADDVFTFRHALTREAIESRLLGRERRRLHERALATLAARGSDDWAARARHAAGACRYDELVEAARQGAARALREGSPAHALGLARLGLEEAPDDAGLLGLGAESAWRCGQLDVALDLGRQWLAATAGDVRAHLPALRLMARAHWDAGHAPDQWRCLDRARVAAEELGDPGEQALVAMLVGEGHMLARDDEALAWSDRALELADDPRIDPAVAADVRTRATVNKGSALLWARQDDEADLLMEQAAELAERSGDMFNLARAIVNHTVERVDQWPVARRAEALRRLGAVVGRGGLGGARWIVPDLPWADLAWIEGDRDTVIAALRETERTVPDVRRSAMAGWFVGYELRLLTEHGDDDAAVALAEATEAVAIPEMDARMLHVASLGAWARHPAHARRVDRELDDLAAGAGWWSADARGRSQPEHLAVSALLEVAAAGRPVDDVARALAAIQGRHDIAHGTTPRAVALVGALVSEAAGETDVAAATFQTATATSPGRRLPAVHRSVAHLGAARCLAALGDRAGAAVEAHQAVSVLDRWPGWRRDAAEAARAELVDAPVPEVDRGADGSALTPRELEVARLVARGCTNGEIGRELHISTKTASVHVSNILAKLTMTGRAEIAAWAVRQGIADGAAAPAAPAGR
jgi:DNA-binding CsgD family transcriptional regulator